MGSLLEEEAAFVVRKTVFFICLRRPSSSLKAQVRLLREDGIKLLGWRRPTFSASSLLH